MMQRLYRPFSALSGRAVLVALACVALLAQTVGEAFAQGSQSRRISIIRDTEIEQLLRDYAGPIFRAAGITSGAPDIILINDRSFNAFVASSRRMFLNIGVLMDAETPNEVIGVIAHETGHIAGGHLARLRQELANAQILAVVGALAGVAAVAGASTSAGRVGNSGVGAMGAITAGPEIARRSLLAYQRSEEQAADRAAVRYLDATGQSAQGMLRTFARFAESGLFASRGLDPYQLSHPLPQERIAQLEQLAKASPNFSKTDSPQLKSRHAFARAKLIGFTERLDGVSRRYPPYDVSGPARYARAIAAHRSGRQQEALAGIDSLLREQPANPHFHELRGQILLESGRATAAIEPLRRASRAAPNSGLIRAMLGRALLNGGGSLDEAIRELSVAAQRERELSDPQRDLATAYARKGNVGMAELSAAQAAFLDGDLVTAQTQATRALQKLPAGSPGALRADDIVNYRPPRS
jgi:predicted Zn-dependent protease